MAPLESHPTTLLLTALLVAGCSGGGSGTTGYDLILRHGTIVDGSGADAYVGDVAVSGGRIAALGDLGDAGATEVLDVTGLVVAPGFIDTHSHADDGLVDPAHKTNRGFVTQGVTTCVFGVDGAPSLEQIRTARNLFDSQGIGTNYAYYVGHNGVRRQVLGMEDRPPTDEELAEMKAIVTAAMEEGMLGLSTGLMYLPGRFATTAEVAELATATAPFGGLYDSHVRDPANNLVASHGEAIEIGETAGVSPHLGHIKAVGGKNFGTAPQLIELVEKALARGTDVTADQYPYDGAAASQLAAILVPPADLDVAALFARAGNPALNSDERAALIAEIVTSWQQHLQDPATRERIRKATEEPAEGVFSWVDTVGYSSFRIVVSEREDRVGRMFLEVAESEGLRPFDLLAKMIINEGLTPTVTLGAIQEDEVRAIMVQPWTMIASDGALTGFEGSGGHPRHRGTFPRVLGRYVREWGVLSLEEAIRKMTSLPADYLRMTDRGRIAVGNWADVVVFDPETIIDRSTWADPAPYSEGVMHVLVNGGFALRDGEMTGATHGRFLPYRSASD